MCRGTKRVLLFVGGCLSLALGVVGIVVPVLPTTPFLLLAAFCFARSSCRAHAWLLNNRVFGRQLRDYLAGNGVSSWGKAGTLILLWAVIGVSVFLFVPVLWARVLLVLVAVAVTIHLVMVKTRRRDRDRRA